MKIPELNLYTRNRLERQNQYDWIKKDSINLLSKAKANNKEVLNDLKAQLYLDTQNRNLKHFISPTKYKEKAQQYLKSSKSQESFLLKAMTIQKPIYHCPHCHYKKIQQKGKCYCEIEQMRHSTTENYHMKKNQQKFVQRLKLKRQSFSNKDQKNKINESENQQGFEYSISTLTKKQRQATVLPQDRLVKGLKFIEDISRKQKQLNSIEMTVSDESLQISFTDLLEAKKQYITKSKQILNSLDKILQKCSSVTH